MKNLIAKVLRAISGTPSSDPRYVAALQAQLTNVGKELTAARDRIIDLEARVSFAKNPEGRTKRVGTIDCPSILFNSAPKSASSFCYRTLQDAYDLFEMPVSLGYFPKDMLIWDRLEVMSKGNQIAHHHTDASEANCWLLAHSNIRTIIHTRDLRQVMVSSTHHHRKVTAQLTPSYTVAAIPESWFSLEIEEQLDWMIDFHLPHYVRWLEEWVAAGERSDLDVLFTRFEDFVENRKDFFDAIVQFCGLPQKSFADPNLAKTGEAIFQFRAGQTDEFRSVMTEQQLARANALIPKELLDRFGWQE